MKAEATLKAKIEVESIKAVPVEGVTLDELIIKMKELGNKVIEINREGNYLLLAHNGG